MTPLPIPRKTRWQPLRGGLLNLYFYDDEVFEYEDGRLLLRGNNGSGKSRVLALQLPFLLDGETRPERMEPDGDSAKRVEWHLLMNGRYPDRTGYTWLELGRVTEDGPAYCTIGCGMHAVQGKGTPTKWFFLTKQRIGEELKLTSPGGAPLTRARLALAIGARGEVFDSAERYRSALDHELFSLGAHRYRALLDLLIALRKPQLSRSLEEDRLSAALSEALPPVSPEILVDAAEAFRALETDRSELCAARAAASATAAFLDGYRRYVSVAARRRSLEVRAAQSALESTSRDLRAAEGDLEAGRESASLAQERRSDARRASLATEQAVRTLESSPEMRSVQALADAREASQRAEKASRKARGDQERAAADVEAHRDRERKAAQECERRRQEAEGRLAALRSCAEEAVLVRVARALSPVSLDPIPGHVVTELRGLIERELHDRRRHLKALARLHREAQTRGDEQRRRGDAVADARLGEDVARAACVIGRERRDAARALLLGDYETWRLGSSVLAPPSADVLELELGAWIESGSSTEPPIRRAIEESVRRTAELMAGARAQLATRLTQRREALATLEKEKINLLSGLHREPPVRHTLQEGRDRDGAPLWAVCEFRDDVPAELRAGYEAALEASSLLDAWISPSGASVVMPDGELYLTSSGSRPARSLVRVLRPAIDLAHPRARALTNEVVLDALERIGDGEASGHTWISQDGRFELGRLRGGWTKPAAEYVGHGAREGARRARLLVLEAEIEAALGLVASSEQELAAHDQRRRALDTERSRAPSDDGVRDAVEHIARCENALGREERTLLAAEEALEEAREAYAGARESLLDAATSAGLADEIDRLDLVDERTRAAELAATHLSSAIELLVATLSRASETRALLHRAEEARATAEASLEQANAELAAASSRAATLEESIGRGLQDILEQLGEAKGALERNKHEEEDAQQAVVTTASEVAKLEERVASLQRLALERTAARDSAAADLLALMRTRVLSLLGEAGEPEGESASTTAAVELARRLSSSLASTGAEDSDWDRVRRDLNARFMELDSALGPHGYRPALIEEASVRVVRIPFRGKELDVHELSRTLDDEVTSRERILGAREREIIESHILGEISTHLHHQLRRAEELLGLMNVEIESRPMSTGMRLKFTWSPHPDAPPGFDAVRPRLLAAQATWSADERRAIADFLQKRIEDVRSRQDAGTWRDHLEEAFDYRCWHRFGISRFQDGRWQPLTRRTHGTGSGGEKAIALTLPQLAAAAAHYRSASPHAPRLILLDEAFVGVDNDMRGKCFDLLGAFDLDFVMTSEREWGCYPVVPALAIYQLTTRPGIDAVHTSRLVWNGKQLHRDGEHLRA